MKKIIISLLAAFLVLPLFAQSAEKRYTPEAGDFAIGFNLNPITDYVGQLFNGSVDGSINNSEIGGGVVDNFDFHDPAAWPLVSIQGKYMLTDGFGIRANLGFIFYRDNYKKYVLDDNALLLDPLSRQKVVDSNLSRGQGGSLSAAAEYRIGGRRVQAVFSAGLMYAFSTLKESFSYGNAITDVNQTPTQGFGTMETVSGSMPNARILRNWSDEGFHTFGAICSVGVEYFIAPKISIGAEVNLSVLHTWSPQRWTMYEGFDIYKNRVEQFTDLSSPKCDYTSFGTENLGANLNMIFYF